LEGVTAELLRKAVVSFAYPRDNTGGWLVSIMRTVLRPFQSGRQLNGDEALFFVDHAKSEADRLYQIVVSRALTDADLIVSQDQLCELSGIASAADVAIIIELLKANGHVVEIPLMFSSATTTAKLPQMYLRAYKFLTHDVRAVITDTDRSLAAVKHHLTVTEKAIETLSTSSDKILKETKTAIRQGNKNHALFSLKRKKLIDAELNRRYATHHNMTVVLLKLTGIRQDQQIFKAIKLSSDALKEEVKKLPIEAVDTMISEWNEAAEDSEQISVQLSDQSALTNDVTMSPSEEAAALQELAKLEQGTTTSLALSSVETDSKTKPLVVAKEYTTPPTIARIVTEGSHTAEPAEVATDRSKMLSKQPVLLS